jgi:hypothetical protein
MLEGEAEGGRNDMIRGQLKLEGFGRQLGDVLGAQPEFGKSGSELRDQLRGRLRATEHPQPADGVANDRGELAQGNAQFANEVIHLEAAFGAIQFEGVLDQAEHRDSTAGGDLEGDAGLARNQGQHAFGRVGVGGCSAAIPREKLTGRSWAARRAASRWAT